MKTIYCDLCGQIVKDGEQWLLFISPPTEISRNSNESYIEYLARIEREVKELCPRCKYIFDKIFEYRLNRLSELTAEITDIYKLTYKPKRRKENEH